MSATVTAQQLLDGLKAVGESTRLRIVMLLLAGELNVKDLTRVLGQSQPRISRHLKLLVEAGLIERYREGSWVYFRLAESPTAQHLRRMLNDAVDASDRVLSRDRERARDVSAERSAAAQRYFEAHAPEWDRIRALHIADPNVERAMITLLDSSVGSGHADLLVDLGTGTGRILELLAPRVRRAIGIDVNQAMLSYARAKLEAQNLRHCQVRQGDLYGLPLPDGQADIVVLHQVLHFLDDPGRAVGEAARLLRRGGRLLIVDFAPHDLEFLREEFAHRRLGVAPEQVALWAQQAGLHVMTQKDLAPAGARHKARAERSGAREPSANPSGEAGQLTVSLWMCGAPDGRIDHADEPAHETAGKTGSSDTMEIVA